MLKGWFQLEKYVKLVTDGARRQYGALGLPLSTKIDMMIWWIIYTYIYRIMNEINIHSEINNRMKWMKLWMKEKGGKIPKRLNVDINELDLLYFPALLTGFLKYNDIFSSKESRICIQNWIKYLKAHCLLLELLFWIAPHRAFLLSATFLSPWEFSITLLEI